MSMKETAAKTAVALFCLGSASHGTSEVAQFVTRQQTEGYDLLQRSNAYGVEAPVAVDKLVQVYEECKTPNWDGYGACRASAESLLIARQLLRALPLGTATPDFGVDPDGDLTLEWYQSVRRTLSVSVSSSGDLHYAAVLGARTTYGKEPFYREVPKRILDLIAEVKAV